MQHRKGHGLVSERTAARLDLERNERIQSRIDMVIFVVIVACMLAPLVALAIKAHGTWLALW
jgi:hypothetical protein